jgi:hypothetical protein
MKPIDVSSFSISQMQTIHAFLAVCEQAEIDVRAERELLARTFHRARLENRRNRKREPRKGKNYGKTKGRPTETVVKQSNIICPDCHKGYLQLKSGEEGIYAACPQCYLAERVFADKGNE